MLWTTEAQGCEKLHVPVFVITAYVVAVTRKNQHGDWLLWQLFGRFWVRPGQRAGISGA